MFPPLWLKYTMKDMFRAGLAGCALFVCFPTFGQSPAQVDYARDIEPLFAKRCYLYHGPQQQMSNLRLDQKESAMRVIQAGNSSGSRLIRMVSGAEPKVMP